MDSVKFDLNFMTAVKSLQKVLQCAACNKQMKTPVTLWSCDHAFCKSCIEHHTKCPTCNLPAWAQDQTTNRRLENISSLCNQLEYNLKNPKPKNDSLPTSSTTLKISDVPVPKRKKLACKKAPVRKRKISSSSVSNSKQPSTCNKHSRASLLQTNKENKQNQKHNHSLKPSAKRIASKNARGETPLHIASMQGKINDVVDLLGKNADVNVKDNAGWTPLHEACNQGHIKIVEKLLDSGAFIDIPGYENDTPLIDAVNNDRVEIVKLLLKRGANVNLRNSDGKTAFDLVQTPAMKAAVSSYLAEKSLPSDEEILVSLQPDLINITFYGEYDVQKAKGLKKMLNAKISTDCAGCTHFVVPFCPELKVKRTLKYFQAMASGSWIVHDKWVDRCLAMKSWTCEQNFLIKGTAEDQVTDGPLRSVSSRLKCLPKLFDGCHFFLYGSFSSPLPTKTQLSDLLKNSGGQILSREPKHDSDIVQTCRKVPYHARPDTPQFYFTYYIVFDPSQKYLPRPVRLGKVCTVSASWILDCVSQFMICDIA